MVDPSINERGGRLDKFQLFALGCLMFIGAAFVFSATANSDDADKAWYSQVWFHQVIWYALGISAAVVVCLVEYHTLARWSFVGYWIMVICLIAVLIPHVGSMRFGARRWIDLSFFQFQPSEFAKLAFILAMANFLSRPADELKQSRVFWQGMGL